MYLKTVYHAGVTIDVQNTFSRRYGKKIGRGTNAQATPPAVREYNRKLAERKLTRLINANFGPGDIHLVLTYTPANRPTPAEAKRRLKNFLKRLRRYYKSRGRELKYIAATAYGTKGAIHHHLVINTMDARDLRELWPYGGSHAEYLHEDKEYSRLATYIVRQAKKGLAEAEQIDEHLWSGSRNLVKPKPEKREVPATVWREPPRPRPGYVIDLDSVDAGVSPVTGIPYLFYRMIRIPKKQKVMTPDGRMLRDDAAAKWLRDHNIDDIRRRWPERNLSGPLVKK